jgi:hypothetical protein
MGKLKMYVSNPNNFPIDFLPPLIKNSILEVQSNTQFPLPLIASSALGAVSLACQNSIDVQPPVGSSSSTSLFILLIADSGEGKTPVDNYFNKPIRDFEENEARKAEEALVEQKTSRSAWAIEKTEIEEAFRKNIKKSLSSDKPEQVDQLNKEFENLQQKLQSHLSKEPKQQRNYKMVFSNITPEKIALDLYENWPSVGLISDEAGSLFRGRAMRDLGMLNQLWDGAPLRVDRVSSPSFIVKNARLSISLMVQRKIFDSYLIGNGSEARDIGFLARCLVAFPMSAKGSRMLSTQPQSWNQLTKFQQRITDLLAQDKLDVDQGRQQRPTLEFSLEAKHHWTDFRNNIESDLNAGGYLCDVDDAASKMGTNVARMAALFHFFEGGQGEITAETLNCARTVCSWYMQEFKRLFSENPEIPIEISDAIELENYLARWRQNHPGTRAIKKSAIAQYGPSQLRKKPDRREDAINRLALQNKIWIELQGKAKWVVFNPYCFPLCQSFGSQIPMQCERPNFPYRISPMI